MTAKGSKKGKSKAKTPSGGVSKVLSAVDQADDYVAQKRGHDSHHNHQGPQRKVEGLHWPLLLYQERLQNLKPRRWRWILLGEKG
jgi:hypothetical protein